MIRDPPKIFIDDSHTRKYATKVQVKQGHIENGGHKPAAPMPTSTIKKQDVHLNFKPLVEVDPTIVLSSRVPLKNPRPGDFMLSKTASTDCMASKRSLELKKRYLLGENNASSGVLKSDSANALDTKFKSFHSNISECQKMLNPAVEIPPFSQTYLQRINDKNTELNKINKELSDEKENRSIDSNKTKEYSETINTALVETKIRELSASPPAKEPEVILETIDLVTPEKPEKQEKEPIVDISKVPISKTTIELNQKFIENMEKSTADTSSPEKKQQQMKSKVDSIFIDLTGDSPVKDRSLVETNVSFAQVPDIISSLLQENGKSKEGRGSKEKLIPEDSEERSRSPAQDTTIHVPQIWNKAKDEKDDDVDTDSLSNSSSSTSSLEDIPHFILDSTTSPETQHENGLFQQPPRLEVRDTAGELMQIDSLMIIDGKYIGDPEDLKLFEKLPEKSKEAELAGNSGIPEKIEKKKESESLKEGSVEKDTDLKSILSGSSTTRSNSSTKSIIKPELKFDTKNENKIESLMNLPLNQEPQAKPTKPNVLRFSDRKYSPLTSPNSPQSGISAYLTGKMAKTKIVSPDDDKTPLAQGPDELACLSDDEFTGPGMTETELSDWAADDATSENFVDIEFALNSNKGTIKRNKKVRRKQASDLQMKLNLNGQNSGLPNIAGSVGSLNDDEGGILRNLAIDEIEFMDTGSEESCIETYSTTNRAMLKNRGYVEFVENQQQPNMYKNPYLQQGPHIPHIVEAVNLEVAGIDYIEQGACILNNENDLKTPMNEEPSSVFNFALREQIEQEAHHDSLNEDDIDEDSLIMVDEGSKDTGTTTDSDVLTIVTSPLESPPRNNDTTTPTTPTNMTTPSTGTSSTPEALHSGKSGPSAAQQALHHVINRYSSSPSVESRRSSSFEKQDRSEKSDKQDKQEEMNYEDYVKSLQMKIAQISSGRDSLETKKVRRKISKSDLLPDPSSAQNSQSVEEKNISIFKLDKNPIEPPQTLNSKLEELSKERVKQKDIIHDLVMDKLQSKKQLNAEKRLNRSRNRSLFIGSNSNHNISSPASNVSLASAIEETTPTKPQSSIYSQIKNLVVSREQSSKLKDDERRHSIHTTPHSVLEQQVSAAKQLSRENIAKDAAKLSKTQSFCVYTTKNIPLKDDYNTPMPPPRQRTDSANTDQMRSDARARARLKSNQDLGLSPEEKMLLLRKKFHVNMQQMDLHRTPVSHKNGIYTGNGSNNKSDDMKYHEKKISASKSYNDISLINKFMLESSDNLTPYEYRKLNDFVSDPNLVDTIEHEQKQLQKMRQPSSSSSGTSHKSGKSHRRDSERRKSLIQTVSDFFYKKKDSVSNKDVSATSSPTKSSPENGSSMFSRFRLSPKSKDKDKAKEKEATPPYSARSRSENCLKKELSFSSNSSAGKNSSPLKLYHEREDNPPPIPPLPLNYQRSDDESYPTNDHKNELKKIRAMSKASKQAELKRLRLAQEIKRDQDIIEVDLNKLESRGVEIEKALRGEGQNMELLNESSLSHIGNSDEKLMKELLEILRKITQLKKSDEELSIRQKELQLEHRHAQLKEELNLRLSCSKLDKSAADVAAEGKILSEMLDLVAKRAALRPQDPSCEQMYATTTNNNNYSTPPTTSMHQRLLKQYKHPRSSSQEQDI